MEGLESEEKNLKVNAVLDSNPVSGDFNVNLLNRVLEHDCPHFVLHRTKFKWDIFFDFRQGCAQIVQCIL